MEPKHRNTVTGSAVLSATVVYSRIAGTQVLYLSFFFATTGASQGSQQSDGDRRQIEIGLLGVLFVDPRAQIDEPIILLHSCCLPYARYLLP